MFRSRRKQHEEHDPADALMREVGAQLRDARLARGEELEDVAENLRIRSTYLHGLEQGDLSVMPGRTYALGFLRSYARYLGFDGDDLIAQIRSSLTGLTSRAHLHGRTPLSESGLPKLPILIVSLAVLAGGYAGWAYVDDRSPTEIDLVAEVPDDLRQQAAAPPLEAPRPEAGPPGIAPAITPPAEPQADAADAAAPVALPGIDLAAATPPTDEPPRAQNQAPVDIAAPAPGAGAPTAVTPAPGVVQPALAGLEPSASGESAAEPAPPEAAEVLASLDPVAEGATPTIYRTDDAASRVILRARTSAWVHVSSTNNDYLWVRTLQPGDAFMVPDRQGLVLWTGNAGGVEVIVDGAPLAPLGPEARVVRDVSLQPEDLLRRLLPAPAAGAASGR
jgi:cytoskeleton protein RodZ